MAVDSIIQQAAAIAGGIPGIKRAWDKAPESLAELPAVILVPGKGKVGYPRKPGLRDMEHDLHLIVLVSRGDLSQADLVARPFIDTFIRTFDSHLTINSTCLNSGITTYAYGKVGWAGVEYVGCEFNLHCVEREVGNYAP